MDTETQKSQLVAAAVLGDAVSFKKLYDTSVNRIYSFCLRLSGDKDTAEELTQRTFIKAWEKLKSFRSDGKFISWLHSIASREYLMSLRSEKIRQEKYSESQIEHETHLKETGVETKLDIGMALLKLPERQRVIFNLFHVEGYKHKEISEMLDITEGTTKAHLHQARKNLTEELNK